MRPATLCILLLLLTALHVRAADEAVPEALQNVGVDEKPDAQLPLDLVFTNEMGKQVKLRDCITEGRPAILQLGYFGCPMLCDRVSLGMLYAIQDLDLKMGTDFSVINLSFNPRETRNDAYLKKQGFMKRYEREGAASGWHFLVGDARSVKAVTEAVGFKYKWLETESQYTHAAVLMILTPDGHVSRYIYGVEYPTNTLRLSLVEASQGRIGTTLDQLIMLCTTYDPTSRSYALAAKGLMRVAGVITVLLVGGWIGWQLLKERRARAGVV